MEIYELVQRYAKDKYNRDVTIEELRMVPWHKIVATHWDANVYYDLHHFYRSLDEVKEPVERMTAHIRTKEGVERYEYRQGKWHSIGDMDESMFKE
jgi:hypothetical protein